MGGVSLFPLFGGLQSLKGFYPPRMKEWFVYLPAIVAMAPYLFLQFSFDQLPVYVSLWNAWAVGIVALLVYVAVLVACKNIESGRRKHRKDANVLGRVYVVIPLLVLFIAFTVSFTYTFNVLENLRVYNVLYGKVVVDGKPADSASLTFHFSERPTPRIVQTNVRGNFHQILRKSRFLQLNGIDVTWDEPSGEEYFKSYVRQELEQFLGARMYVQIP